MQLIDFAMVVLTFAVMLFWHFLGSASKASISVKSGKCPCARDVA